MHCALVVKHPDVTHDGAIGCRDIVVTASHLVERGIGPDECHRSPLGRVERSTWFKTRDLYGSGLGNL